jgi:lysophospholipase L1-like esterase
MNIALQEDIIIWGDSITAHADGESAGKPCCSDINEAQRVAFQAHGLQPVLFGISGDQTSHLAWRLQHGEWPNYPPRVALLLIGTNDLGYVQV